MTCNPLKAPACSVLQLGAVIMIRGVRLSLAMPCDGEHVVAPTAAIAEVRPLLDSKLMRTLVSVAQIAPSVYKDGESWRVGRTGAAGVTLSYDPKHKLVTAWGAGRALWDALGIAKVPVNAWLDLDGKLLN